MKNLKSIVFVSVLLLFAPVLVLAQCDDAVLDSVNMLGSGFDKVLAAAHQLENQGADVRIRTLGPTRNLDIEERNIEEACPSWQGSNRKRKSNLVAILVSQNRKVGMYYGSAWRKALDDHWNRIQTDYMLPRFREGDIVGGLVLAQIQTAKRLEASKEEVMHPVQNNTTVQATNYNGLWTALLWFIGLLGLGTAVYLLLRYLHQRSDEKEQMAGQKARAVLYRNQCASLISINRATLADATALSSPKAPEAQSVYDDCLDEYSRYQKSVSMDPDSSGLPIDGYVAMASAYEALYEKLLSIRRILNDVPRPTAPTDTPPVHTTPPKEVKHQRYNQPINPFTQPKETPPVTSPTSTPNPEVVERTVVVNNGNNDMLTGILVGDALSNSRVRERESDREEEREREVESERSSFGTRSSEKYNSKDEDDKSDNDSGGGSTNWGSNSSSDSDSGGGSSDFSSDSSSDNGGGGSSDF